MQANEMAVYLRRGLGRVVLFLQTHQENTEPYREVILNACLNDECYEQQTEDGRAFYLDLVVMATGEPEWYTARVCEILQAYGANSETATEFQRCELAGIWALKGSVVARRALYIAFERSVLCSEPIGEEAVIRLDGAKGVEKVVALCHAHLPQGNEFIEWWHVDQLVETLGGAKEAEQAIQRLKVNSPEFTTFYDQIWQNWEHIIGSGREARLQKERAERKDTAPTTYEEFQAVLDEQARKGTKRSSRFRFSGWGKTIPADLLERLAADIKATASGERLYCLLRVFWFRAFPLAPSFLFPHTLDENPRIAFAAVRAMMHTTHSDVRSWGLHLIESGHSSEGIELLVNNPGDGDAALLLGILQTILSSKPHDEYDFHRSGMFIRDYYEVTPSPDLFPALLFLYENGPCSMCRGSIVKLLLDANALPDALHDECRYDADEGTRELIAA